MCGLQQSEKEITLFYISEKEMTVAEIKKASGRLLPKYMIPSVYIRLDKMPMNTNGKIDRLKLNNHVDRFEENI